jgi:hypothetical protein
MQPDHNRQKALKEGRGLPQNPSQSPKKTRITPTGHTVKMKKAWKTREAGRNKPLTAVSPALRREYNFHSMASKIVQQVDAAAKLPHNYDAAAHAAMLHGNLAADLSVMCCRYEQERTDHDQDTV